MAIILPESRKEILQNLQTDFVANIPESDPFIRESWLLALLIAISYRDFDIYTQIGQMILQLFPNTATGIFARQWGNLKGVNINSATSATGFISVPGVAGTKIPEGTPWANQEGSQYEALNQEYTISEASIKVSSLVSSGGIAKATTISDHLFGTGMTVDITGADQSEYNGAFEIIVTGTNTFQYPIIGTPLSPATTTTDIRAISGFASVLIQSLDQGEQTNLGSGAQVTLINPIPSVNNIAYVQFTEIGGGSDAETDDEYRARYLERYQQQVAHFNEAEIIETAKQVPGVTNVDVFGLKPEVGDVTVFFLRYNDVDPIPNGTEVGNVRDQLATITPAHTPITDTAGLIVKAPTPQYITFAFATIVPNTSTMKEAIEASLDQFFKEKVTVGLDITQAAYTSAILQTVDPATGLFVESFTLSNPTGDISVDFGNVGILSGVTF